MKKYSYIAFHKPYGVLCQFTGEQGDSTLADFNLPKGVYAAGRLDKDSEGLLILTDDGIFNQRLTNPNSNKEKIYRVQVENIPTREKLNILESGVEIQNYKTKPCKVQLLENFELPPRDPPIRERKSVPTSWLEIHLTEGKNRQVRRMTAKIGHPTLRLIRWKIGQIDLTNIPLGKWIRVDKKELI